jgi:hypothetical protein
MKETAGCFSPQQGGFCFWLGFGIYAGSTGYVMGRFEVLNGSYAALRVKSFLEQIHMPTGTLEPYNAPGNFVDQHPIRLNMRIPETAPISF